MKRIFSSWWITSGLIVLMLVLLFCLGLPLVVGWLRPPWVRLAIGGVIVGVWLAFAFVRRRRARKASEAIAQELAGPSAGDQEEAAVAQRMGEALRQLRTASGNRRDYLYSRPWYVIIGPPGSGKTTALLNSGLRFPFSDQSLKGVGGTRNLDFWFADEAALVDTAGRYTTQDSDSSADSRGWKSFLALMRRHRPKQPINGVIVALGVDELLRADCAGIDRHAALVRRRLAELRETLEISTPIYLFLTKVDLLAGFVEFYDDLDVEGRRAVLGTTFPDPGVRLDQNRIVSAFDQLVTAQDERQAKRLYEEVDTTRRSLILGFPAQLAALRDRVARFVDGAFVVGDRPVGLLRGFYFTSGVQEGAPLDRILAGVADVYSAPRSAAAGQTGRTYFLNRLLSEVVFREAGLVQTDRAALLRQKGRFIAGSVAIAAAAAVVLVLWGISFFANRDFQSDLLAASVEARTLSRETGIDLVEVRETDPDLEQSLGVLNALRALPHGYAERAAGKPGLFERFGLYQTSHSDAAVEAYRDGLRRIMLPRLLLRLEQYLNGNTGEPMALYEPLKVYLMLGDRGPMNAKAVKRWVAADWANEQFPGSDRAEMRRELSRHLDALLEDGSMSAAWPGRKASVDGAVIASARAALQTLSLSDRAYAVLRQRALAGGGAPWRATTVLAAGDAQAFANGADVLALEVPYLFTKAGFQKSYQLGLATVQKDLRGDLWVMGGDASTLGVQAQVSSIRPGVAALYARDYIAAWEKVLTTPKPAAYFTDDAAFGAFTKTPSPLKVLLLELRKNTRFDSKAAGVARTVATERLQARLGRAAALAPTGGGGDGNIDAGIEIATHFRAVQDYVGDGKTLSQIDEFVNALRQAKAKIASARITGGGPGLDAVGAITSQALGDVIAAAAGAPPEMRAFAKEATEGATAARDDVSKIAIADAYAQNVLPQCRSATQDRYPFFGLAEADADLVEVQQVFGLGGVIESFFRQRVLPLLDTSGPIWRWNADDPVAQQLNPSSPDEFAKAAEVRDLLVGGVAVKVEAKAFGGEVDAAELSSGGATARFERAAPAVRQVSWSAQGGVPEAGVALFKGATKVWSDG
ncbi:MAG: type VI secretion system membrane subunit TssM, partial [Novosphingobium sp.]